MEAVVHAVNRSIFQLFVGRLIDKAPGDHYMYPAAPIPIHSPPTSHPHGMLVSYLQQQDYFSARDCNLLDGVRLAKVTQMRYGSLEQLQDRSRRFFQLTEDVLLQLIIS